MKNVSQLALFFVFLNVTAQDQEATTQDKEKETRNLLFKWTAFQSLFRYVNNSNSNVINRHAYEYNRCQYCFKTFMIGSGSKAHVTHEKGCQRSNDL